MATTATAALCAPRTPPKLKIDRTSAITASFGRNRPSERGSGGGRGGVDKRRDEAEHGGRGPRRCVRQWHWRRPSLPHSVSQEDTTRCLLSGWLVRHYAGWRACEASVLPFYCSSNLLPQFGRNYRLHTRPPRPEDRWGSAPHPARRRCPPARARRSRSCHEFRHPSFWPLASVSVSD